MVEPRVTVVIATYNWSEALRCSIPSALRQSYTNFELLVVGDCCTDDSEAVVAGFADPRLRWHNLPERWSSQSGPNNYGAQVARGEFVAHLGHDDVWHPDHLRTMVAALDRTGAGIATSIAAMYGPPGSGIRGISGIFAGDVIADEDFFPPSATMARLSLLREIGPWRRPEELSLPVDCELLQRARAAGARVVSTRRLTVFKFNSAWRRDSYRRRDTSCQQAMLKRLEQDAEVCAHEELAGLLQAAREGKLIETRMPDTDSAVPGELYRANMAMRGLAVAEAPPISGTVRFPPTFSDASLEWHPPEEHPVFGHVRWSGPSNASTVVLPVSASGPATIRIGLLNWMEADLARELRLFVSDVETPFTVNAGQPEPLTILTLPASPTRQNEPLKIRLESVRMRSPHLLYPVASRDTRWLGVCLAWIEASAVHEI